MKVHGKKMTDADFKEIASLMENKLRCKVMIECGHKSNEKFVDRYLELDPMFEWLLIALFEFER